MAITGTKLFASGDVLTAADTNQYLMRGVKVFSSTAVRDAAYGGAGEPTLEEGETCYITATDELQTYNGSSWVDYRKAGAGQVLQVVQTVKKDTFTTTSTSFVDVTGMSATITPSSTSSTVLIIVQLSCSAQYDGGVPMQVIGGNAGTYIGDAAGSRIRIATTGYSGQAANITNGSLIYLDSPSTTSATTYKLQIYSLVSANTVTVNRSFTDTDSASFQRAASSITVMEISA